MDYCVFPAVFRVTILANGWLGKDGGLQGSDLIGTRSRQNALLLPALGLVAWGKNDGGIIGEPRVSGRPQWTSLAAGIVLGMEQPNPTRTRDVRGREARRRELAGRLLSHNKTYVYLHY